MAPAASSNIKLISKEKVDRELRAALMNGNTAVPMLSSQGDFPSLGGGKSKQSNSYGNYLGGECE